MTREITSTLHQHGDSKRESFFMRTIGLGLAICMFAEILDGTGLFAQTAATEATASNLYRIDAQSPQGLQELLQYSNVPLPIVSGHRGGATVGFPENCIETFEHTLTQTFAMLEIDPRVTRDGHTIVIHDATLQRTTTGEGRVADLTLDEIKQLRLRDRDGQVTDFQIPTLDEVIEWARGKTVLVLDQKDLSAVDRAKVVTDHHAEAFVILIVTKFQDAQAVHRINPNIMMEVIIPTLQRAETFESLGAPWRNVVAFVGHQPPTDKRLYDYIHRQGARCMVGTSRNLDKRLLSGDVDNIQRLEPEYHALLDRGADLIETDTPLELGRLLYRDEELPPSLSKYPNETVVYEATSLFDQNAFRASTQFK